MIDWILSLFYERDLLKLSTRSAEEPFNYHIYTQTCPESDAYALAESSCAFAPLPLACVPCILEHRLDQNDDEAMATRGGGEELVGAQPLWCRPHPRRQTAGCNDPIIRQAKGKETFASTDRRETACAGPPQLSDPETKDTAKGRSERGGDGGQTGP